MGLFSFLSDCCSFDSDFGSINPGSGLPMLGDCMDIAGNAFGCNSDSFGIDNWSSTDSSFGGSFSSFD